MKLIVSIQIAHRERTYSNLNEGIAIIIKIIAGIIVHINSTIVE